MGEPVSRTAYEHEVRGNLPFFRQAADEFGREATFLDNELNVDVRIGFVKEAEVFLQACGDCRRVLCDMNHLNLSGVFISTNIEHDLVQVGDIVPPREEDNLLGMDHFYFFANPRGEVAQGLNQGRCRPSEEEKEDL